MQPRVLSATASKVWTREHVGGCSEWRTVSTDILVASGCTPVVVLQGEILASTVGGRDMKIKITFAQYMLRTRNLLLEGIFRKMIDYIKPKRWLKQLGEYTG